MKKKRRGPHYVYIVSCSDGTYYTGYTNNLEHRIKRHNSGKGAKYVRGRRPVALIYSHAYRCYKSALRAERTIKKLSKAEKEYLVAVNLNP